VVAVYVVSTGLLLLLTDRERAFVRRAFGQYLAPDMIEKLAEDPSALKLGGETRAITVMFCDIRGFTTLAEGLGPQELTYLLNSFLTPMTRALLQSGATIDKYIGDAIMAFWNAPLPLADHPKRACLAVLEMLKALDALNQAEGRELRIGAGLNTGEACVGNLGSEQRFSYSAIGDAVNVASRIEGLTKQFGISALISEATAAAAHDLALLEIDLVRVVGRTKPMAVFAIVGDEAVAQTPEFHALAEEHMRMLSAYRDGDVLAAEVALDKARALAPLFLQPVYDIFNKRLAGFRREPPGPEWQGVFEATEK
jgi:adenylate cyclase